jgi:hypothetical protein
VPEFTVVRRNAPEGAHGSEFIYPDKYAGLNVDHRRSASTPEDVYSAIRPPS